jgi:amino acid adenylation domain-containing protein
MHNPFTEEEREKLLRQCSGPRIDYPPGTTVLSLFEASVIRNPVSVAVSCGEEKLSYAGLHARCRVLAASLQVSFRIGPGHKVALLMDRSVGMVAASLAILKCGALCIPIDKAFPEHRLCYILENSGADLLITDVEHLPAGLPVPVYRETEGLSAEDFREIPVESSSPAYIIYTSGSTGNPKGVLLSHHALADYIQTFLHCFQPLPSDRFLHHSSLSFDTSLEELYVSLAAGAEMVISRKGGSDMNALWQLIEERKITLLSATPLLIGEINRRARHGMSLRILISGGEELKPSHVDRLLPYAAVYNTYGPAESTVCSSCHRISEAAEAGCIGEPLPNRQIYILDADLQLLPPGEAGEIAIAGPGLAEGYVGLPSLTALRFVKNPFGAGNLYLTGDRGCWQQNGTLRFLGRNDRQVKIHGYRIELMEIEAAMLSDERIQDVVVLHAGDEHKFLAAFYCSSFPLKEPVLVSMLEKRLPAYMIPSRFVHVQQMPLLVNGKKDVKSLSERLGPHPLVHPKDDAERTIATMWKSLLEKKEISMQDRFFEIGGNSIKAVYLHSLLEERYPGRFRMADLFSHPTISAQARIAGGCPEKAAAEELTEIEL